MSTSTLAIKALALKVNDLLDHYVAVHDKRFTSAATFSSVLKNLIGRGPDFKEIHQEAEAITEEFSAMLGKLQSIKADQYEEYSAEEQRFFDLLLNYVTTLHETCAKLSAVTSAQERASKGKRLSWQENHELENAYKESIAKYMLIGGQLNDAFRRLG